MTRGALALLAVVTALALPAVADAAVRCVGTSGGDCTQTYATTSAAVTAAVDGVDTIRFGAGTFGPVDTPKVLTWIGAGPGTPESTTGATVILQTASSESGMNLQKGGTVRDLRAQGGPSSGTSSAAAGIEFGPTVAGPMTLNLVDVIAAGGTTAPPATPGGAGLALGGSTLVTAGKVVNVTGGAFLGSASPAGGGLAVYVCCVEAHFTDTLMRTPSGPGIYASIGSNVSIEGSTVEGSDAIQTQAPDALTVSRSRVVGVNSGFRVRSDSSAPTTVTVRNSLITAGSDSLPGLAAVQLEGDTGQPVTFNAFGSTLVGRGATQAAVYSRKVTAGSATVTTTLRNSIARAESSTGTDLWADGQAIGADFSSFNTRKLENGGQAPEAGSASNVAGDPLLASDYSLQPGSPLVDRGDASILLPGELDLAGAARSLDGNGDCVAAPDIGAFERPDACPPPPPPTPNAAPTLTRVRAVPSVFAPVAKLRRAHGAARKRRVKRGTRFVYTLSEPATVRITIQRRVVRGRGKRKRVRFRTVKVLRAKEQAGRQSTAFSGRVKRKALTPGRYRARLVATDAQGAKSAERRLALRIVRP